MDNEFITNNEGVLETIVEDTVHVETNNGGLKTIAGIGLTIFVGAMTYKYIVKPIVKKFKQHKVQQADNIHIVEEQVEQVKQEDIPNKN